MTAEDKALILLADIDSALKRGVKHYSKDGDLLPTAIHILQALARDGFIVFDPPEAAYAAVVNNN